MVKKTRLDEPISIYDKQRLLDGLLYFLVKDLNKMSEKSVFWDLHRKYIKERAVIKTENYKVDRINRAVNYIRGLRAKLSSRERILQRLDKQEIVENIFNSNEFKVGNFEWRVVINKSTSLEERDILANALENYPSFELALKSKVISIENTIKIHDDIDMDVKPFNEYLKTKMRYNYVSFFNCDFKVPNWEDDRITEYIINYQQDILDGEYDEYDTSDDDLHRYFIREYLEEMRAIAFRLFSVYEHAVICGINVTNANDKEYKDIKNAIHYYNLEDMMYSIKEDDDNFNEYDDLPGFYKLYIHNLCMILIETINRYKEHLRDEEGICSNVLEMSTISEDIREKELSKDYKKMTKRLVKQIRRIQKDKVK